MKEILSPFKQRQTLMQAGLCALVFIGMAVPFKVMVLVEGFTEVRPLMRCRWWWGCLGLRRLRLMLLNLIADFFGTFQSLNFRFLGNFFAAYLPSNSGIWKIEESPM